MNNNINNGSLPIGKFFLSVLVALFADIKCINWGLAVGGFVSEGIMAPLYMGTVGSIAVFSFVYNREGMKNISTKALVLSAYLLAFFYITVWFVGFPRVTLPFFLVFTISAFLIPQFARVDTKVFLRAVMILPSFSILRIDRIFASYLTWMDVISMDASYGYLVPIIATVVYIFTYFKNESKLNKAITICFTLINAVFLAQLMLYGSRGPLLAIALLFIFMYIVRHDGSHGVKIYTLKMWRTLLISIILLGSLTQVASLIDNTLTDMGFHSYAIHKIVRLEEAGDITNGRDGLIETTFNEFLDYPLLGHGLDRFEAHHDSPYPHNFILQILYDGGILLLIVLGVPFFKNGKRLLHYCTKDEFVMFTFLFFASVPGSLFSQDMWQISILWMFFGYLMSKNFVCKNEE